MGMKFRKIRKMRSDRREERCKIILFGFFLFLLKNLIFCWKGSSNDFYFFDFVVVFYEMLFILLKICELKMF